MLTETDTELELESRIAFFKTTISDFESLEIGYNPFDKQRYLHSLYDWGTILVAGGVRFSKSYWAAKEALYRIYHRLFVQNLPRGRYWLIGKDYSQTGPEWDYLYADFKNLGLLHPKSTRFNGDGGKSSHMYIGYPNWSADKCAIIETKSADSLEKIAGRSLRGVILCEAAQNPVDVLKKSAERLSQTRREGSWLIIEGTFEGSLGWYPQYFERWKHGNKKENAISVSCPSWENPFAFPGGRDDPEILKQESERTVEDFLERYGGEPCPPKGSVMSGVFEPLIHVNDEIAFFDEDEDVYLWYDPGFTHPSAVMAIQIRKDSNGDPVVNIIDEVYTTGKYASSKEIGVVDVIDLVEVKPWYKNVNKSKCTIDYHGFDKRAEGSPVAEQWRNRTGITFRKHKVPETRSPRVDETGVDLLKRYVKVGPFGPHVYINSTCKGLISEWGGGQNPLTGLQQVWCYKTDRQGNVQGLNNLHDDASKAVIYGIWDYFGYAEKRKDQKPVVLMNYTSYSTSCRSY